MTTRTPAPLRGILAAVTTPFTDDASAVDEAALRRQVDRLVDAGIHGLVPTGTTGEFTTLSDAEYRRVIELYVQSAAGRIPVVAGIGSLSTAGAIELAQYAEQVGADAIMLVPPFYDPLSFEALTAFVSDVAAAIRIPIVYYNVPGATGIKLTAAEIAELGDIDGVEYLKDTSGDAVALAELLAARGDRITAFNGWDTLTFFGIASGAQASVWGVAGIVPDLAVQLWNTLAVDRDLERAREQWRPLWELSDFLESVNYVAGVKAALELTGNPVGPARLPIQPLPEIERDRLAGILERAGVLAATVAA
jgi:dihydrodipicolinate synthase/N-acetylneuraminate lyase